MEFRGHVLDMPELFASADIVVLPSYREGLPKSLIEAAACARPLVTTDVPGCREVVTDFVDGLLVPVRDAHALARAIAHLQDDPALARRLGEAARRKALAEFDEHIVIARTLAVYDEVAACTCQIDHNLKTERNLRACARRDSMAPTRVVATAIVAPERLFNVASEMSRQYARSLERLARLVAGRAVRGKRRRKPRWKAKAKRVRTLPTRSCHRE